VGAGPGRTLGGDDVVICAGARTLGGGNVVVRGEVRALGGGGGVTGVTGITGRRCGFGGGWLRTPPGRTVGGSDVRRRTVGVAGLSGVRELTGSGWAATASDARAGDVAAGKTGSIPG
jgi:hypothetical protein